MRNLVLFMSMILICGLSYGASKSRKNVKGAKYTPFAKHDYRGKTKWTTIKEHKKDKRAAKRRAKKRRPASLDEGMMSEPYKEFRDKVLGADTPQKLHALLIKARVEFDYVEQYAKDHSGNYPEDWPGDKRFFVAQIIPVIASRSLYYRLKPLLEFHNRDKKNEGLVHSMTVTFARNVAAGVDLMLPYDHTKAAFKYISEPFYIAPDSPMWSAVDAVIDKYAKGTADDKKSRKADLRAQELQEARRTFVTAFDVQDFMRNETYRLLQDCERRVKDIDMSASNFVWDNKFVFGYDYDNPQGVDPLDRFRRVGEREQNAVVASVNAGMAAVLGATAYNADGMIEIMNAIGEKLGVDAVIPGITRFRGVDPEGLAALDRYRFPIEYKGNTRFAQLKKDNEYTVDKSGPNAEQLSRVDLAQAFLHVREAVMKTDLVRLEVDRRGAEPQVMLDPAIFTAFRRVNALGMGHINQMFAPESGACVAVIEQLKGHLTDSSGSLESKASRVLELNSGVNNCVVEVSSATSGKKVKANVLKMYISPVDDLRLFMPGAKRVGGVMQFQESAFVNSYPSDSANSCSSGDNNKTCRRSIAGETVEFRNYHRGAAKSWSIPVYQTYFPDVSSNDDLKLANRVLSQTWGGWVLGGPLAGFML